MLNRSVRANGIDIHYAEAGTGEPLLLLDNAMVSADQIWAGHPSAYAGWIQRLAERFRVIVPDTRGSGRTVHPGGAITHDLLADDVAAFITALGLEAPAVCGFSDGGEVATVVGIRYPAAVRAVVNHAGFDLFNPDPQAPALMLTRQMLGGGPQATQVDHAALAVLAAQVPDLRTMFDLMETDHDAAQGSGHWRVVLSQTFERISRPHGYTVVDLASLPVPTLILTGDRDPFCSVEEAAACYRALPAGELAVVPGAGHAIDASTVDIMVDFLRRS